MCILYVFAQCLYKIPAYWCIFYSFAASFIVTSLLFVSTLCLYFERPVEENESVLEIDTREEYKNPLLSTIVPIMTQLCRLLCDPFYFFIAISGGMMFGSIASFAVSLNTFVKIFGYSQVKKYQKILKLGLWKQHGNHSNRGQRSSLHNL